MRIVIGAIAPKVGFQLAKPPLALGSGPINFIEAFKPL